MDASTSTGTDRVRKPRPHTKPYVRKAPRKTKDAPKTSARKQKQSRQNLTLHDWLTVVAFYDAHKDTMTQPDVVRHFANRPDSEGGALIFTQSSLSRHISALGRQVHAEKLASTPTALNMKRARIVTRPDVEQALVFWVKHMEEKGEHVSGPMLATKRSRFEDRMGVPEEERMRSDGWIANFTKAYGLKEYRRHGEAGSVDTEAVAKERDRVQNVIASYNQRDVLNFDESSLFPLSPPDRGLASKQMSGKKASKFRITVGFMVNATGSEKYPIFFIGKSKQPRCFKKTSPQKRGFYYRNNKTAWMTAGLFEEWIKERDLQFRRQNRHVLLLLDNFSGHAIDYKPTNIRFEFFAPNMTSFVQPLDAGIIRCFKAHYRQSFCRRAIDLDEAGNDNIYDLDLLEGMLMANEAWAAITQTTIRNCWKHTQILPSSVQQTRSSDSEASDSAEMAAWDAIRQFAVSTDTSIPDLEKSLREILGSRFVYADWARAIDIANIDPGDSDDVSSAIAALDRLEAKGKMPARAATIVAPPAPPAQLQSLEQELQNSVNELKARKRIHGEPPSLEELLDPKEERQQEELQYEFPGGDDEIVAAAQEAVQAKNSDTMDVDRDSDDDESDDEDPVVRVSNREGMTLCERLEQLCLTHSDAEGVSALELTKQLRRMRAHFRKLEAQNMKQKTLDTFFSSSSVESLL